MSNFETAGAVAKKLAQAEFQRNLSKFSFPKAVKHIVEKVNAGRPWIGTLKMMIVYSEFPYTYKTKDSYKLEDRFQKNYNSIFQILEIVNKNISYNEV